MLIGFNLPLSGPTASPAMLARLAAEGEAIGYDYAAISDHIVEPTDIHARYPYTESGEFPASSRGERHEQLTVIAYLAAKTSRLKFLTSVMVAPHRPAVLTAKMLATIDVMSGGRLIVGVGAGWLEEEFAAIGAPPFAERGAATDEYLMAFRELWTKDKPRFDGRFVKFADILFAPKPVQKPCPALWVGGESGPAMRRAARLGDRLRKLVRDADRDPASIALAFRVHRHGPSAPAKADNGERLMFSGSNAEIIDDLRAMRELGVKAIDFNFADLTVDAMRQFHEEVGR
jgi:probable F420-dependent oxidoreductase